MEEIKFEGIVIGSIPYKETSKIVYLYTRNGRISIRALGALKQKKGMLPLVTTMNRLEVITTNKNFPSAIDYTLIDSYEEIKSDLKKELWFSLIFEIISKLTPDSPHDRIYEMLLRMLELGKYSDPLSLGVIFMIKMTYGFGVEPILKKCAICGNLDTKYFSIKDAGAICNNHPKKEVFDQNILESIKKIYYFDIYKKDIDELKDINYIELFKVINIYYGTYVNIYLKGISSIIL